MHHVVFVFAVRVQVLALALASMRISTFFCLINLSKLVSYYYPFILMVWYIVLKPFARKSLIDRAL